MGYLILFFVAAVGWIAAIVLGVFYFEDQRRSLGALARRWRVAWSQRRVAQAALRAKADAEARQQAAEGERDATVREMRALNIAMDQRVARMGSYIVAEQAGDQIKGVTASNYHAKEKRVLRAVEVAAENGYRLPNEAREQLARMLKEAHGRAVRVEAERQRQAEIKAEIREEERRQRELERAIRQAEREAEIKRRALEEAIAMLGDGHAEQVERLRAELAEAQANAVRAKSMAEQTRAGHIYVISNIGSFGRDVFKVGMTRRLEPLERIAELGDASVPFGFDVHAMIASDDAPALEAALHRVLSPHRVNRVNLRKEFFRVDLGTIIAAVREHHGEVEYVADAEALEYLESEALAAERDTVENRLMLEAGDAAIEPVAGRALA